DSAKLRAATPEWVPAKDVRAGDFLVFPKPHPIPASTVMSLDFARLLGYYLAEGRASLVNGCKALEFSFHSEEFDYVDEVRQLCKELYDAEGSVLYEKGKKAARVLV